MNPDLVAPLMQAVAYILLLIVLTIYYIKAFRQPQMRRFWLLFALAMTMTFMGNVAWIIRFAITQTALDQISAIDLFYGVSYILIGFVIWSYPGVLGRRVWLWVGIVMSLAAAVIFAIYFGHVAPNSQGTFASFIIFAGYPILDSGLVTLAWMRYQAARDTRWAGIALLVAMAITSYGLANTIELAGYLFNPLLGGVLQNFFWILRHVLLLIVALRVRQPADVLER
jgi:hypothetical protein